MERPLRQDYTVRRSDRAKRVRVTVHPDRTVEVVLPRRAKASAAERAVRELEPWIARQLRKLDSAAAATARPANTVPFIGVDLELVPEAGRTRVHRRGDRLHVPATDPWPALERWYRAQARTEIGRRLDVAVAAAGASYTRLTIRNQRTRWGSCSTAGAMSFNWRLLLAPEDVLDYVVCHEVAHLERMDHSPAFWALLDARMPGWREPAAWLRRYGTTLVLAPA